MSVSPGTLAIEVQTVMGTKGLKLWISNLMKAELLKHISISAVSRTSWWSTPMQFCSSTNGSKSSLVKSSISPSNSVFQTSFLLVRKFGSSFLKSESNHLNPSVPAGPNWRIFFPLRKNCARLRDHRMSWIVSKRRLPIFITWIEAVSSIESPVLS